MVRNILPDDQDLQGELHDQSDRRRLVPKLAMLRNVKDVSQEQVAAKLGCGQSRISKLENGYDADVTVGDLIAYAGLAQCNLYIVFESASMNLVDQVKHHACCISRCFDRMNELAKVDTDVKSGVAKFHLEALVNLVNIVGNASQNLHQGIAVKSEPMVRMILKDNPRKFLDGFMESNMEYHCSDTTGAGECSLRGTVPAK